MNKLHGIPYYVDENGCYISTCAHGSRGYANIKRKGKYWNGHRYVHFMETGELPPAVRHECDNPPCINPDHLISGTQKQNIADSISRGRFTHATTITDEQLAEIRQLFTGQRGECIRIAKQYGVSVSLIRKYKDGSRR